MIETVPPPGKEYPGLPKTLCVFLIQEDDEEGGFVFRIRPVDDPVRPGDPLYDKEDDILLTTSGMWNRLFIPGVEGHQKNKLGAMGDLAERHLTPEVVATYKALLAQRYAERKERQAPSAPTKP